MKRTLGVAVTRHIWLGTVEDHRLTDTQVFPLPGGGTWDIRSMPADQVAETIREQIARVAKAQPVTAVGLGFPGMMRDGVVEEVGEQFDDAPKGAMADEDQSQDELANPGAGDGEVEQDRLVVVGLGSEGLVQGVVSEVELLVDELAANLVLHGESRDGLTGKGGQSDLVTLLGRQKVSGTVRRCRLVTVVGHSYDAHGRDLRRSWVVGTALDLRDPGFFAHPCPPRWAGSCYPALNQVEIGFCCRSGTAETVCGYVMKEKAIRGNGFGSLHHG